MAFPEYIFRYLNSVHTQSHDSGIPRECVPVPLLHFFVCAGQKEREVPRMRCFSKERVELRKVTSINPNK